MKITDDEIITAIQKWLATADMDELSRVAGELLGGKCFPELIVDKSGQLREWKYDFQPNEFYYGAFGNDPELTGGIDPGN